MTKNLITKLGKIAALLSAATLLGCGGGNCGPIGSGSNGGTYNLVVDNTSPVPLINTNSQQFYVYVTNIGNGNATDLNWSIPADSDKSTVKTMWHNLEDTLGFHAAKNLADTNTEIKILDASSCLNIGAGKSCSLLLQADDPANVILQSTSSNSTTITQNVVSAYNYTPSYTDASSTLTLSPLSPINDGSGFASYTFFIINNSTNSIGLDQAPFGLLPAGMNYSLLAGQSCPNPLPAASACQVRLTLSSSSIGSTIPVALTPTGSVIGGNVLPTQGTTMITVSSEKVGNISTSPSSMNIDSNSSATATSFAYITNTGSAPLVIGNLTSGNPLVSIGSDECSGKTLAVGAICRYQLNINPTQITAGGSAAIAIPYNDGKNSGNTSASVSWSYTSKAAPNASISLTANGNLNQNNLTRTVTITNNGNVILRDLGALILTTTSSHVTLANSNCGSSLALAASCSYTLTYTPAAPSETTTAAIGGLTAKYIDATGILQTINFPATTSVNVDSIFQGLLTTDGDFNLLQSAPTHTVTITNTGTNTATISNIALNGANLQTNGGTCSNGQTLNAASGTTPAGSCTVIVGLTNASTAGSGNGSLTLTYNNHNGSTSATVLSNISWLIGQIPNLNVAFAQSNLVTTVGGESTTLVTLSNNGNTALSNIVLPVVPAGFSWEIASANSCTLTAQTLNIAQTCNLKLKYTPTMSAAGVSVTLGSFTANSGNYTTNPYQVTVTAVREGYLSFSYASLPINVITLAVDWTSPTRGNTIIVTNTNPSLPINITSTPVTGVPATATGCGGILAPGATCNLDVVGTYSASGSGSVTVNYTDSEGTQSQALPITVTYQAQPIITPNLVITANPSGMITVLNDSSPSTITLTLTNNTSVQNAISPTTDGGLLIKEASLVPASTAGVNYTPGSGSTCTTSNSYIVLSNQTGSNSCTYVLNATSNAAHGTTGTATTTSQYQSQTYTNPNTVTYGSDQPGPQIAINTIIQSAAGFLSAPALVNSGQINAFVGVEQGISVGPISFTVQNVGSAAISGAITPPTIAGFTFNMSNCTNLAANDSCTFSATLNSANPIASSNLNTKNLTYNTTSTVALPNMQYSVIAANSPAIALTSSISNCQKWSGSPNASTCLINTGSPAPIVSIALTNVGSGIASNFTVNTTALVAALGANYSSSVVQTNCPSFLPPTNTCTLTVNPTTVNTSSATTTAYDINTTTIGYSYNYGTNNQLSANGNTNPFSVDTTVASPSMNISQADPLKASEQYTTTVTLSDWYSSSLPANPTISFTPAGNNITSPNTCTWSATTNGATCDADIQTSITTTPGMYAMTATTAGITSAAMNFTVTPPPAIFTISTNRFMNPGTCQSITADIPGNTGTRAVNFSIPVDTIGQFYFADSVSGSPSSTTSCSTTGTSCQANAMVCNSDSTDNIEVTITATTSGYSDATTVVGRNSA